MSDINLNGLRTYNDFEKLRKSSPQLYWSGKIQSLMHNRAFEMGDKFFVETSTPNPSSTLIDTPVTNSLDRRERIERLREELDRLEDMNEEDTTFNIEEDKN